MNYAETQSNPQLEMAFDYVANTNRSVFLTGKAGTGKTTFLHRLKQDTPKRITIVAPTGVAAINAGGVTMHSLFQLPFTPYIPQREGQQNSYPVVESKKFSKEKIKLIKSIDLLVIDEISMVRCDVLDAVNAVLRQFRDRSKPFGGVQLLLIGDINQLAPVAKDDEWNVLKNYYETIFFFSSHALKENFPVIIELRHIFRQSDSTFIELLNKIRNKTMEKTEFDLLNSRLNPKVFENGADEGYITLCTHNVIAKQINSDKLDMLPFKSHFFKAEITGDFPEYSYPTDENLELKSGAQVMFIKNDTGKEKRYFNGKIGRITKIDSENISVTTDETDEIEVTMEEWKNIRYTLNSETKTIDENTLGTFKQFPLKLAYAITIHKSQGLTFDKVIIDARAAFSSGQVYVALSRCRTLEGIILSTPISSSSIKSDLQIDSFNTAISNEILDDTRLTKAKSEYQASLLMDLLDFGPIHKPLLNLRKVLKENTPPLDQRSLTFTEELLRKAENEIGKVLFTFQKQVKELLAGADLTDNNELLQVRLKKGASYFSGKLNEVHASLQSLYIVTDNKTLKENFQKASENAGRAYYIKAQCFQQCSDGFSALGYTQTKANADIDFDNQRASGVNTAKVLIPKSTKHPELYKIICELRKGFAIEAGVEEYRIFQQKALSGIVNELPMDFRSLERINGIGKATSQKYGIAIIDAVKEFCENNGIEPEAEPIKEEKATREIGESYRQSFEMFLNNLTTEEIAKQRGLAVTTINGHLAKFVERGSLSIGKFLTPEKMEVLTKLYEQNPELTVGKAKEKLGDDVTYADLNFFSSYRKSLLKAELLGEE